LRTGKILVSGITVMKYLWDERGRELREALKSAHEAYIRASEASKAIIKEGPSALPHPDGMQRLVNAANEERHALDEYVKALRAFNDYVNPKKS
jgi:hypothetical protein